METSFEIDGIFSSAYNECGDNATYRRQMIELIEDHPLTCPCIKDRGYFPPADTYVWRARDLDLLEQLTQDGVQLPPLSGGEDI